MRGWRRTSARGCSWACSALLALACTEAPTAPITSIRVLEPVRSPEGPFDPAVAEGWAGAALSRVDGLRVRAAKPGERRWQATVRLGRRVYRGARPEDGGALPPDRLWREVEASIELRAIDDGPGSGGPGISRRLSGARYFGLGRAAENVGVFDRDEALVERAIGAAAQDLSVILALEVAPEAELLARIGRGTANERIRAIEAAGLRKVGGAVDALVALVPDPVLGPAATGALVAIGDPRAVGALIESARDRPLMSMVFAVAQLGGREAEAWLFTVGQGHPNAQIRAAAKEALGELERRRGARPTPTP